jgi:hypothetical protein
MSADGNWKITMNTPMGPQSVDATIKTAGNSFTGRFDSPMGSQEVNGTVQGDVLTWSVKITQPMTMEVGFTMTVEGDGMTGTAKLGMFGEAPVTGQRV